jgi:hypothetical protein
MRVELLAGDAGLHGDVQVLGVDRQHLVHGGEIDRNAASDSRHVALERGAGAERHHRHGVLGTDLDDPAHFIGRAHEGHRLRRLGEVITLAAPMLLADRSRRREPVAEQLTKRAERASSVVLRGRVGHHRSSRPSSLPGCGAM